MKIVKKSIVAMAIGLIALSCEPTEVQRQSSDDVVDYVQLGIDHNEGLERMFTDLKANNSSGLTINGALKIMKQSAYNITLEKHPEASADQMEPAIQEVDNIILNFQNPVARGESKKELYEVILDEVEEDLSEEQKIFLDRIFATMTTGDPDLAVIHKTLDLIEYEVRSEVSAGDLHVLLSAIYLTRASSQYWHDNFDEWVDEFGGSVNGRLTGDINWGKAGLADIGTAITVGGVIAVTGWIPVVGWIFWGTVTGASAAVISGLSVILDITQ